MKGKELYEDDYARIMMKAAGSKWHPLGLLESDLFWERWCWECARREACDWVVDVYCRDPDDTDHPGVWRIDTDGQPVCTEFAWRQ